MSSARTQHGGLARDPAAAQHRPDSVRVTAARWHVMAERRCPLVGFINKMRYDVAHRVAHHNSDVPCVVIVPHVLCGLPVVPGSPRLFLCYATDWRTCVPVSGFPGAPCVAFGFLVPLFAGVS